MNWVNLIISGTVQGIGFRNWVQSKALLLNLTGWVKNRDDGSVELVAQGERNNLEQLVDACWDGPEGSWVEDVKASWGTAHGQLTDFKII